MCFEDVFSVPHIVLSEALWLIQARSDLAVESILIMFSAGLTSGRRIGHCNQQTTSHFGPLVESYGAQCTRARLRSCGTSSTFFNRWLLMLSSVCGWILFDVLFASVNAMPRKGQNLDSASGPTTTHHWRPRQTRLQAGNKIAVRFIIWGGARGQGPEGVSKENKQ